MHLARTLLALLTGLVAGHLITANVSAESPRWACAAEDEIVVIDHTCQHIDMLTRDDLLLYTQQGTKP